MLNKKDPLIGAVQQVMHKSNVEREATRLVNEAFGIEDRKALPHEYQAEWNSVYQQVLAEGKITHPNQQVLNVHEPEKPELTSDDFRKLRAMKAKKKSVSEQMKDPNARDVTSPSSMGIKKPDYATGTPDYAKPKTQTVNRAEKKSLPPGTLAKTMKEAAPPPPGMVQHLQASAAKAAAKDAVQKKASGAISRLNSGQGAGARQPVTTRTNTVNPVAQTSGPNRGLSNAPAIARTGEKANPNTQTSGPNRGLDQRATTSAPPPPRPTARPADLNTTPKVKKKVAPKAAAPKAAPQPKKKLTHFQKQELRRSEKNDTMDQTRRLKKRYGVMEQIQNVIAERMSVSSGGQGGVNAPSIRQQNAQGPRRAATGDVAPQAQQGADRVGAVIRTNAERIASRTGQNKSFDASYNAAAGTSPRNSALDQPDSQSPMAKAIANRNVPTNMSGGGGDYRKAQASPIKVSDTEIMNSPEYKKALKSVGGNAGAKKIQAGERVAGLGRFNTGDTITSRTQKLLAARKNVGRES